ncbi:hypothetical protein [Bacillus horti]|uniref:LPXTG cell wall anchor domain-containing protein n=1 Tax=Caldalkalibacillus horti TaxID=77523 RepID=A0ABT9W427_9BACI|nr:hypothetical protein [Bacillus horti]MDQ0167992.1 hypothetical protein [Bacillus horti]
MKEMKYMKYVGYYCLFILLVLYLVPPERTSAIDSQPRVDLTTSAEEGRLFTVSNFKPGDWAEREIVIGNKGNRDFFYTMSASLGLQGEESEKFYEALELTVEDSTGELYAGKLSKFTGLEPRFLRVSREEALTLTVKFPFEYGNDYQALETVVLFIFSAEARPDRPPETCEDRGDCPEPPGPNPPRPPNPPTNCAERGDCPEPPKPRPDPPKTCVELENCEEGEPPAESPEEVDPPGQGPETPTPDPGSGEPPDDPNDSSLPGESVQPPGGNLPPGEGGRLPNTSSPWYNLLLIAFIGIVASAAMMWLIQKRSLYRGNSLEQ